MTDYSNTFGGAAKDAAESTILAADHDTEYDNVATMSATKANKVVSGTTDALIKQSATGDLVDASSGTVTVGAVSTGAITTTGAITATTTITATGNISGAEVQVAGTDIFETIYPVGSIYQSTVSTNPATLFGVGTWTALEDRFLIGESATYAAASTGGSADAIVVLHKHTVGYSTSSGNDAIVQSGATGQNGTVDTQTVGSSGTNANLPPYLAVYMWERTA
jgi:hypothetical protein